MVFLPKIGQLVFSLFKRVTPSDSRDIIFRLIWNFFDSQRLFKKEVHKWPKIDVFVEGMGTATKTSSVLCYHVWLHKLPLALFSWSILMKVTDDFAVTNACGNYFSLTPGSQRWWIFYCIYSICGSSLFFQRKSSQKNRKKMMPSTWHTPILYARMIQDRAQRC